MNTNQNPLTSISSFFFYMWNSWNEDECKLIFGKGYKHYWSKWCSLSNPSPYGAAEKFFSELGENARNLLIKRATTLYEGKSRHSTDYFLTKLAEKHNRCFQEIEALYEDIKTIVVHKGGFLLTQANNCDPIFSIEYLSIEDAETVERIVAGLRVEDGDLQIFSEINSKNVRIVVSENDLKDPEFEDQWISLKSEAVCFAQTVLNIAANLYQYV